MSEAEHSEVPAGCVDPVRGRRVIRLGDDDPRNLIHAKRCLACAHFLCELRELGRYRAEVPHELMARLRAALSLDR